jgi:adenylate cyclase
VTHPDAPEWIDSGLLDPESPAADQRTELLVWMTELGIPLERMVDAHRRGQLSALAGDDALRPGPRLTPRSLATRLGIEIAHIQAVRRASGFPPVDPDEAALTEDDVRMFELFEAAASFFTRDEVLHLASVMGSSMRRIADAAGEMFLRDVEGPMRASVPTREIDLARTNLAAIELARAATGVFVPMFLSHMEVSTERTRAARRDSDDYETVPLAVGFVDLGGFTERSSRLSPHDLRALVVGFEGRATGIVGDLGGRVVKLIGDEVMFSTVDSGAACAIALALTAAAPDGSTARGGVAFGDVVASGGDVYGPVVNLASRIADIAIAGEVLVDDSIAAAVASCEFEPAGRRSLKGFSAPVRVWTLLR